MQGGHRNRQLLDGWFFPLLFGRLFVARDRSEVSAIRVSHITAFVLTLDQDPSSRDQECAHRPQKKRHLRRYLSVDRQTLLSNRKANENAPVLRLETELGLEGMALEAEISGPSRLVYRPESPRPHGVEIWVETDSPVRLSGPQCAPNPQLARSSSLQRLLDSPLLPKVRDQLLAKLEKHPQDETALRRLGDVLRQLGDRKAAAEVYSQICRLFPGDATAQRLAHQLRGQSAPPPKTAWPVGFSTRSNFLEPAQLAELQEYTLAHADRFDPTRVLHEGVPQLREQVRKSSSFWEIEPLTTWFNPLLRKELPQIQRELGFEPLPLQLGGCKISRYGDGAFFAPHIDRGPGARTRVFGFIFYFWFPPQRFEGGGLAIYDWHPDTRSRADTCTNLLPNYNELIIIPADCWHEVLPVKSKEKSWEAARFTLNGWISLAEEP